MSKPLNLPLFFIFPLGAKGQYTLNRKREKDRESIPSMRCDHTPILFPSFLQASRFWGTYTYTRPECILTHQGQDLNHSWPCKIWLLMHCALTTALWATLCPCSFILFSPNFKMRSLHSMFQCPHLTFLNLATDSTTGLN